MRKMPGFKLSQTKVRNYSIILLIINSCCGLLGLGGEVTLLTVPLNVIWGSLVLCCKASGGNDAS